MTRHHSLREEIVERILPHVQTPAQYLGNELNVVRKPHGSVRGRLCLAFPDVGRIDVEQQVDQPYKLSDKLPWDHLNVEYGCTFLEKEQTRSTVQLDSRAGGP